MPIIYFIYQKFQELMGSKFSFSKTLVIGYKIQFLTRKSSKNHGHQSISFIAYNQWERSGSVLDSRPKGSGFEPHRRHCVVVLEQDTFILA